MDKFVVSFAPLALEDIQKATDYYNGLKKGLGKKFILQLNTTLNSLRRNAFFASVRYDDIRCAQVKKFPYLVHYQVNMKNEVTIIAVYSTYKQPFWD